MKNTNDNKSKNKIKKEEKLEYNILGNAYIGDLFNMSENLDNTSQNIMTYMESDEIQKAIKNKEE